MKSPPLPRAVAHALRGKGRISRSAAVLNPETGAMNFKSSTFLPASKSELWYHFLRLNLSSSFPKAATMAVGESQGLQVTKTSSHSFFFFFTIINRALYLKLPLGFPPINPSFHSSLQVPRMVACEVEGLEFT